MALHFPGYDEEGRPFEFGVLAPHARWPVAGTAQRARPLAGGFPIRHPSRPAAGPAERELRFPGDKCGAYRPLCLQGMPARPCGLVEDLGLIQ